MRGESCMHYTKEQIDRANRVNLEEFLRGQGEVLIKSGREFRWKEHDSLTVKGNKWFSHSQSKGGYSLDFVMEFYGKTFPEAMQLLIGKEGFSEITLMPEEREQPPDFHLPLHNRTNENVIEYLTKVRGLNESIVKTFLLSGDIYEDRSHHNAVFVGRGRTGTPCYAHARVTKEAFRQDVSGSDKSYSFRYESQGNQLFVF